MWHLMNKKSMYSLALIVSLLGLLSLSAEIQNVHAPHLIITIEADGSISPPSANITTSDNITYTFTADINASIIVQRSNIVIDGDGWTLNGVDFTIMRGFNLTGVNNVVIKNVNILRFGYAMWLEGASQCVISNNTYITNEGGIWLVSSTENIISDNNITGSVEAVALDSSSKLNNISDNYLLLNNYGVYAKDSFGNLISGNKLMENRHSGVYFTGAFNNTVIRNEITSDNDGMHLYQSSNNRITENNLTANHGIAIVNSHNNTLCKNSVEVTYIGIDIFGDYNIISGNNIENCDTGFFFGMDTVHNTVSGNNIEHNEYGLYFEQTSNNSIVGNQISNNTYGILLDWYSLNMEIYHNTFSSNTNHMVASNPDKPNVLDNGVEGNYWSNYTGVDFNHDGMGDTPHVIDANNTDYHPLMGMFHSFNTSLGKSVNVISNSTVDGFEYESPGMIRFTVSNTTQNQTHGFCRVTVPYEVLSEPSNVTIDGANPTYWNYTLHDNGTHQWIYFEYEHSTKEVVIIPEFPSIVILPLFMTLTLIATITYRRKPIRRT